MSEDEPLSVTDLNINTTFKEAWDGFMRMDELTYLEAVAKKVCLQRQALQDQTSPLPKVIGTQSYVSNGIKPIRSTLGCKSF